MLCKTLSCSPIPDFWLKKIRHLSEPGNIQFNHYICKHGKLRPYYKDVVPKSRSNVELSKADNDCISEYPYLTSLPSPIRSPKKTSPKKDTSDAPEANFTYFNLKGTSSWLGKRLTERLLKDPKMCVDALYEALEKINFKIPCSECIVEQRRMILRRHLEAKLVQKLQERGGSEGSYFAVNAQWASDWSLFANFAEEDNRIVNKFLFDQFFAPESIKNKEIMAKKNPSKVDSSNSGRFHLRD